MVRDLFDSQWVLRGPCLAILPTVLLALESSEGVVLLMQALG